MSRRIVFIMANPSTADALTDDATIRKCTKFAKREGFFTGFVNRPNSWSAEIVGNYRYHLRRGEMEVVNLFAYRATDPDDLLFAAVNHLDVVGPFNNNAIFDACRGADFVVCAWGKVNVHLAYRERDVRSLLRMHTVRPKCLKYNTDGSPSHPLYLKDDLPLVEFTP